MGPPHDLPNHADALYGFPRVSAFVAMAVDWDHSESQVTGPEDFASAMDLMHALLRIRPRLSSPSAIAELRERLRAPERQAALFVLLIVDVTVVAQLVPELFTALLRPRDTELVRGILGRLPRDARQPLVRSEVARRIETADDDEYRRIAELLYDLGQHDDLRDLVARALAHSDPDIREVGQDFDTRS